jgi:hypothetical protein
MKKILILQPYLDQSQAIAKFLKKYSNNFFIIGALPYDYPSTKSIPFFDSLERISSNFQTKSGEYDLILPTGAESTNTLMQLNECIRIGNIAFYRENLRVCNKISILNIINELNIPIPETYNSVDEIKKFPVFYKQRVETGRGSRGVIKDKNELDTVAQDNSIFFQEFIDSPITFGVGFLARDGILITSFIQKELYSYPKPGGSGVILQTFNDKKLLEYTQRILKKLNFNGWGLVEFKYCPKIKDYVFMEVNAKFWASIEFALMNNSVFFEELFNIHYNPKKEVNCIVFFNRLAEYGINEYLTLAVSHMNCHKLYFRHSLFTLILNAIPQKLKSLIKKYIR